MLAILKPYIRIVGGKMVLSPGYHSNEIMFVAL